MERLQWKDEFAIGVELIDTQHKVLVGIINELYEAIIAKKEGDFLDGIFKRLVEYAQLHFETEERYFDQFSYADAETHKKAHKDLHDQLVELQDKKDDLVDNPFQLMDFLEDWLIDHDVYTDKLFGPCFNENGLK